MWFDKRERICVGTDLSRPRPPLTNNGGMENGSINADITMGDEDAINRSLLVMVQFLGG